VSAPEPTCVCGHPFLAHVTVHLGGCVGARGCPCGPDCRDECVLVGDCDCRQYEPDWDAPAPAAEKESER
jgi:hypothetical protein